MLRKYIAKADALCVERFNAKAEHLMSRHLLQRRRLFAHAMDVADLRTALAVLKDEAQLECLYDKELSDRLAELESRLLGGKQ